MSRVRLLVAIALIAGTGALATAARTPGRVPAAALDRLPYRLGEWQGRDAAALDGETLQVLGADAYLNRSYAGGVAAPVGLYIAYYAEPKPGVSVHSPLHCLPGTGWEAIDVETIALAQAGDIPGQVRRMVVRRNTSRAVVRRTIVDPWWPEPVADRPAPGGAQVEPVLVLGVGCVHTPGM